MAIDPTSKTTETAGPGGGPGRSTTHFEQFTEPGSSAHIHLGQVVDVCQQRQLHMVRCAGHQFFCPVASGTGNMFYGARDSLLFPVGSFVIVVTSGESSKNQGVILGGFPPASATLKEKKETSFTLAPELVPGTPIGPYKDKVSSDAFKKSLADNPLLNKNAGRPIDAYPGDIVHLTELGCGFWAGRATTVLRAGHDVGVECHYVDSLLRLTGFNFEQFTAGSDITAFNDEGAFTEITRLSPYVIESMGGKDEDTKVPNKKGEKRKESKTETASYIPEEVEQVGYWRYLRLTGYLGDVDSTYVTTLSDAAQEPRKGGPDFEDTQDYNGVFKRTVGVDGAYTLTSAKSISLVKDLMIPVPQEIFRPDDPRGDNQDSGFTRGTLERTEPTFEEEKAYSRALSTHDIIARQSNYISTIAVQEHTEAEDGKDWDLKEITELKFGEETGQSWEELKEIPKGQFWAELPKVANIKIDKRTESAKYFLTKSCIAMHEDGSIHLEDGYGGQISMRGGNIDISCPGTLSLRPGNDAVTLAGRSITSAAGENVEIVGMKGDVRLQADRNISVLGGNDGKGGVLIESKAETNHIASAEDLGIEEPKENRNYYGGVWLKSRKGTVSVLGKQTYMGCDADGTVIIDGNENGQIMVTGNQFNTVTKNLYFAVGDPDELTEGCHLGFNQWGQCAIRINTQMALFADSLFATGSGAGARIEAIMAGTLFVDESMSTKSMVDGADPGDEFDKMVEDAIEAEEDAIKEYSLSFGEFLEQLEESVLRVDEDLKKVTFAYPKTEERGLPKDSGDSPPALIAEAAWQTRYKDSGSGEELKFVGVDPTEEVGSSPEVSGDVTSFWPGTDAFETAYAEVEFKFIDIAKGAAVDRAKGTKYNEDIPKVSSASLTTYLVNTENKEPGS